jgi:hypothetical protein
LFRYINQKVYTISALYPPRSTLVVGSSYEGGLKSPGQEIFFVKNLSLG